MDSFKRVCLQEEELNVAIDYTKFEQDAKWDGLKGYITNAKLTGQQVLDNYHQLWQIEKAFRIAKTELKIRPIYHRLQKRIEAHICITFAAYKVFKELERLLKQSDTDISATKAIEIAKSIYAITLKTPNTETVIKKTLILSPEQQEIAKLFDL